MRDDLLHYYERELTYLRRTGAEFARRYPKIASRLLLEPNKCEDPHVERMLEGFAFLAARVHLRMDDDFPELSESLLNVVYPHYIRPLPAVSLAQFHLDREQGKLAGGLTLPAETPLYSRPVGGTPCRFRTCYDTTLWPVGVASARWMAPYELRPAVRSATATGALRIELQAFSDLTFAQLELETLRLHLSAEPHIAATLYEVLCNNTVEVLVRELGEGTRREPLSLPASVIRPVGFEADEGLFPYPKRSYLGYRLLQEYFSFPEKFMFLDLGGFDRVRAAGFGNRIEVIFLTTPFERADRRSLLENGVNAETIRLGCTPVVNLFTQTSEPILLNQRKQEYRITPDARRLSAVQVFSIEEVVAVTPGEAQPLRFEPIFSFRHGTDETKKLFWYAQRRPMNWRVDEGTDVYLSFVDLTGRSVHPDRDAVTARLLCFNGDLPSRLPFGDARGDFEMPGGGPIERITTLVKPTPVVQPPLGKPQLWRLISQLSLNYTSLVDGGPEALQELLRLHNFADSRAGERQIQGLVGVSSEPTYARIESDHGLTFARGHRVELEFDEEEFAGGGMFLFASVLERFLGLYTSLNSFCVLTARSRQRKEIVREWAPRTGWKALL